MTVMLPMTTARRDLLVTKEGLLPSGFLLKFGCPCEWRGGPLCPLWHPGIDLHDYGALLRTCSICDSRRYWVLDMLPDYAKPPSHDRLLRDFNILLSFKLHLCDHRMLSDLKSRLAVKERDLCVCDVDTDDHKRLDREVSRLKHEINVCWDKTARLSKTLIHYTDQQYSREQPKRSEILNGTSISQISDWLRSGSVTAIIDVDEVKKSELETDLT